MGLFSWLSGKNEKTEVVDPIPSDYVIASKIATILEISFFEESIGLAEMLKPTCATTLDTRGNVSLRWLSGQESMRDVVSFALINRLPAFVDLVGICAEMSKAGGTEALRLYLQSMGRVAFDQIATQALHEMKDNAKQAERSKKNS